MDGVPQRQAGREETEHDVEDTEVHVGRRIDVPWGMVATERGLTSTIVGTPSVQSSATAGPGRRVVPRIQAEVATANAATAKGAAIVVGAYGISNRMLNAHVQMSMGSD